jgi:nicotinic acid mononucleotide adenylyltransferase
MDISRWRQPCLLFEMATLVGVPRPGAPAFDPVALDDVCPGASRAVEQLDGPTLDISAEELRRRVSRGLPIDGMVPCAVSDYIRENGLYTDGTSLSPAGVQTGR